MSQPQNSGNTAPKDPRKIQKGPNIGQNEEHKIEKYLENKLFSQQTRRTATSVFLTSPKNTYTQYPTRHNPTNLPKIDQNRKKLIRKIET